MKCPNCKALNPATKRFCVFCGDEIKNKFLKASSPPKKIIIPVIIASVCALAIFGALISGTGSRDIATKPNSENLSSLRPEESVIPPPAIETTVGQETQATDPPLPGVVETSATEPNDDNTAVVIAQNANLRETANIEGAVTEVIPEGSEVRVTKKRGPWFFVTHSGRSGWLHGNAIKLKNGEFTPVSPAPIPELKKVSAPATQAEIFTVREQPAPPAPLRRIATISEEPAPTYSAPKAEPEERGTTATAICADGTMSYSTNSRGTCSHHGGVSRWLNGLPATTVRPDPVPSGGSPDYDYRPKTVNVRGYYRKDGTYVKPHTRRAPRRRN